MNNLILALPSQILSPYVVSVDTQLSTGPVQNVLDILHPFRPWRASPTMAQQQLVLKAGTGAETFAGVHVENTNYAEILLEGSADGATWYAAGPNLLKYSGVFYSTTPGVAQSPWTGSATGYVLLTDLSTNRSASYPSNLTLSTTDTIAQQVSTGVKIGGRSWVATVWLRSQTTSNYSVRVRLAGTSNYDQNITVTPSWTRFTVVFSPPGGDTTTNPTLSLAAVTGSAFVQICNIMLTPDATESPRMDYTTGANGLQVPIDYPLDPRRHAFFPVPSLPAYLRYTIPAQAAIDGAVWYSTGALTTVSAIEELWGGYTGNPQIGVNQELETLMFPSGGREVLIHGALRRVFRVQATMVSRYHNNITRSIFRNTHQPFLVLPNMGHSERVAEFGAPYESYLAWFVGQTSQNYSHREIYEMDLAWEECV